MKGPGKPPEGYAWRKVYGKGWTLCKVEDLAAIKKWRASRRERARGGQAENEFCGREIDQGMTFYMDIEKIFS